MLTPLLRAAGFLALAALAACASPAEPQNMTVPAASAPYPAALRQAVCVGSVTGGAATNPMWVSQVDDASFRTALEGSLRNAGLLAAEPACRYKVQANLLGLSQPLIGLDLEVTAHVNYRTGAEGRQPFLVETISSPYTATFGDAAIAIVRLRLANEGSIRKNITIWLDRLRASSPD